MSGVVLLDRAEDWAAPVASLAAVLDIERVPLSERNIPATTYEMLKTGAALAPDSPALSFFAEVRRFKRRRCGLIASCSSGLPRRAISFDAWASSEAMLSPSCYRICRRLT